MTQQRKRHRSILGFFCRTLPNKEGKLSITGHIHIKSNLIQSIQLGLCSSNKSCGIRLTPHSEQTLEVFLSGSNYTPCTLPRNCILALGCWGTSKTWWKGVSFSFIWNRGFVCWHPRKGEDISERAVVPEEGLEREKGFSVGKLRYLSGI